LGRKRPAGGRDCNAAGSGGNPDAKWGRRAARQWFAGPMKV
jgi:hypothetical protein